MGHLTVLVDIFLPTLAKFPSKIPVPFPEAHRCKSREGSVGLNDGTVGLKSATDARGSLNVLQEDICTAARWDGDLMQSSICL